MTVLVTGAAGFLGSHVVDLLLARGEQPRALVGPDDGRGVWSDGAVEMLRGDITDPALLERALTGVDRVIHCAARTGPWGPEAEFHRINVQATENLARGAAAAGVRRFVHVSSIVVHGADVHGTADEDAPVRAEGNPYSRSKVAGEQLIARMIREEDAPVTIVRPGWIYGPRDRASFARVADRIERGGMVMLGPGDNRLPLIYVRDVAEAILLASKAPGAAGRTYILVDDEPVTQRQFLAAIAEELGVPAPRRSVPYRVALGVAAAVELSGWVTQLRRPPPLTRFGLKLLGGENRYVIERARRELGFSPSVGLVEGVRRSVRWYRPTLGVNDTRSLR